MASLMKEYKEQEEKRQEVAKQAADHYKRVDLPGTRTFQVDIEAIRKQIEEMKKVKALPNHD
ncbi:MAG: hypothetical protein IPK21_07130 [Haliscomenobacter sp.]|jgi:hypothetical protein|nr:hypothetical protein [Haliscomenobacter sp.]